MIRLSEHFPPGREKSFAPVTTSKRSDEVAHRLIELIQSGSFKPGARLPSGRRLQSSFGVSQPTIREALRTLEAMGLISIRHGSGVYVTRGNPLDGVWSTRWMQWTLQHARSLLDLLEVREVVEGKAAALAAQHATRADLNRLERALKESERLVHAHASGNVSEALLAAYVDRDISFHSTLAKAGRNQPLSNLVDALGSALSGSREATLAIPGRMQRSLAEHRAILAAVARRDPHIAQRTMEAHVRHVREEVHSVKRQSGRMRDPSPRSGRLRG